MIALALDFAFACFGAAMLMNMWVVAAGRTVEDRILALDTMVINAIALLILHGIWAGTAVFFEAAMIIAMLGFVSTVAYARFILRGNIIE
ncbi:K+/H+ antiporter subunit F [Oceanicella actignis]|uniref:Multicomponent K+:H+ antiporter subunit F n=1 Tax=Oceanicella actignis TaxID=1189325 RepID=A0A1M7SHU4_9RHOB|nr:K+/H+ antiporter subunit F [Oceanicella actignis]TYO91196.1 multisubunit potassium/proton antiporter PhaF subunit [Oceanicella actignis]SET18756.1 multisubunit potassium/proton antiporter, PhaF subunit [Oceanicella actignis]SHN58039.1 multicomponent K+:H+ antiporter subunit F [Oceanicella actignis]